MTRPEQFPPTDFGIEVPSRRSLFLFALFFAAIATLVLWLGGRLIADVLGGAKLSLSVLLLLGSIMLILSCGGALLILQRLQKPLENARYLHDDQAYRIGVMQETIDLTVTRAVEASKRQDAERLDEAANSRAEEIRTLRADLAHAERRLELLNQRDAGSGGEPDPLPRDPLTGVHHGSLRFQQRLGELIETSRRSGAFHGLLLIGLDDLGKVHDAHGPMAGEEHIWQLAQLIIEHTPSKGELYRLSAKHFAMLLPEFTDRDCSALAHKLCTDVAGREFAWKGQSIRSAISIGAVSIGLGDQSEAEIIERAIHALGAARQLGGGRVHSESLLPALERRAHEKSLSTWLKEKLKSEHLRLAGQAIVPAKVGVDEPSWVELLLRIEDDDGVWLTPEHFVDVLERMQLTSVIDKWVMETALQAGPRCATLTRNGGRLSINIFGSSLLRDNFLMQLRDVLVKSALPTQQICFELDEAFVVQHPSRVAAFVNTTAEFGCVLALDRYRGGVGLSALRHFPAQYIKLHESLVQRQTTDLIDRAHLDWLVTSAHLAGAKVVASAVRDAETLARLRQSGVDYVQGFAIAKPTPYAL